MSVHIPKNMVQKEFEMANYSNSSNVLCWRTLAYTRWKSFWPILYSFCCYFGSLKMLENVGKHCKIKKFPFYSVKCVKKMRLWGKWNCVENESVWKMRLWGRILTLNHKRQWWKLILVWPNLPLLLNNVR